jgi:prepilin-type N-terminal cleavage/methylation domain-containing protein
MKLHRNLRFVKQQGFTLLELLIVVLILGIVTGAVFSQMGSVQQRMSAEQVKIDDLQQARDFVDQFFRDINQIGDPNTHIFDATTGATWTPPLLPQLTYSWASPYINDSRFAIGLVKIDSNELHFEGSVNGVGTVQSVIYMVNGSGSCTLCMQRSQVDKITADPLTGQATNWGTEVNDVTTPAIFTYFKADGTQVAALPVDYTTAAGAQTLAAIKTVHISLRIRNPQVLDQKTGQPIETSFEGEVSLNNCSMAATAMAMSCN